MEKPTDDLINCADEEILYFSIKSPNLFKVLIDRYEAAFLRRARRIIKDEELVKDVVVETFTKIYFRARQFQKQEGASFSSWGYKILTNTALSYYQRQKREQTMAIGDNQEIIDQSGVEIPPFDSTKDGVESVLIRMPRALANVLRKHFIEGWSLKEIAKAEAVSLSAVKVRAYRAKREFKRLGELMNLWV